METKEVDIRISTKMYKDIGNTNTEPCKILREYIDNSTSSFFEHDKELGLKGVSKCKVEINWDENKFEVVDNAYGMNYEEFIRCVKYGEQNLDYHESSRGQYGQGLKYASACLGNKYTIITTALNSNKLYKITFDLDYISREEPSRLPYSVDYAPLEDHYTKIIVENLKLKLTKSISGKGHKNYKKQIDKIKDQLGTIYRYDILNEVLKININGEGVESTIYLYDRDEKGNERKVSNIGKYSYGGLDYKYKYVIGVLKTGNQDLSGLSIIQHNRAIYINYKPVTIFGRGNDYRQQRVVGELFLEGPNWTVTFQKDQIKFPTPEFEQDFFEYLTEQEDLKKLLDYAKKKRQKSLIKETDIPENRLKERFASLSSVVRTSIENVKPKQEEVIKKEDRITSSPSSNDVSFEDHATRNIPITFEDKSYIIKIDFSTSFRKPIEIIPSENEQEILVKFNHNIGFMKDYMSSESKELKTCFVVNLVIALYSTMRMTNKDGSDALDIFISRFNEILLHTNGKGEE